MNLCDHIVKSIPTDAVALSSDQIKPLLAQIPQWQIANQDGIDQLQCRFKFANFVDAMQFANAITKIAEQADHHPTLLINWGEVCVYWWSHSLRGLHGNDFVMAAKTQQIYDCP